MFKSILKTTCLAVAISLTAPVTAMAAEIEFEGMSWTTNDNENSIARVETYEGREALLLRRTMAALEKYLESAKPPAEGWDLEELATVLENGGQ